MKTTNKETQIGYFRFFFSILRFRLLFTICLNISIGLLDGIGLTMLIPLLQSVDPASQGKQSTGQLGVFFSVFKSMGIPLTVNVILVIFLCIFIVKAGIKYIAFRYQINVQLLFIKKIQQQFLSRLQRLSYEGYLQLDAGKIQNTVVSDVSRVSEAMRNYLRWSNSFFLLLTYIFLAYLANPPLCIFDYCRNWTYEFALQKFVY
jgi:subfamily B ATP-binding cassette protein MsbA